MNARRILALLLLILGLLILLIGWKVKKRGYLLPGTVSVTVDERIAPHAREIPGFDNDPPRPVAALTDGKGTTTSFVENEFIVMTDDAAAASEVAARCGGAVVRRFAPRDFGLESPSYHLIRMADPKSAAAKRLTSDLQRLNPGKSGQLIVSSETAGHTNHDLGRRRNGFGSRRCRQPLAAWLPLGIEPLHQRHISPHHQYRSSGLLPEPVSNDSCVQ